MLINGEARPGLPASGRRLRAAFWVFLAALGAARLVAVFTQNVNWDEFALLQRAVTTLRVGEIQGGGRPGLATLVLIPFAEGCRNAVDALVWARVLWTLMVFGAAAAFWVLLKGVLPASGHRWTALAVGLSLWVMAPVFLSSSTQVRADQPAILLGLLGGVALLASRDRAAWAVASGALFALGFLFSQKLLYVGALVGVLAGGQLLIAGQWRPRREAVRVLLTGGAFLLGVLAYRALMTRIAGPPDILPVARQLDTFAFYREVVGWREYREMLPLLLPQGFAIGTLIVLSLGWISGHRAFSRELIAAWAVLAVGVVVLLFHAGRFPYFYMTLGLFPATVGALVMPAVLGGLKKFVSRGGFLVALGAPLATASAIAAMTMIVNNLGNQRDIISFVDRSFPDEVRGYDATAAFACRYEADPFPVRFAEHVWAEYSGEDGVERGRALIEQFRARPVAFMIPPLEIDFYPPEVRDFWATRYVAYFGVSRVAGRSVAGPPGWAGEFEVVVPGDYVWRGSSGAGSLEVDGELVPAGAVVRLGRPGTISLRLPEGGSGMLVLALREAPTPNDLPFYRGF